MKELIIALAVVMCLTGCAAQQEEQPSFRAVNDIPIPVTARIVGAAESVTVEEQEAQEEAYEEEYYEEYYGDEYYEEYYEPSYSGDGFMQDGVRPGVDSDTETWYSSNQAYHYRTSEWSTDEEGYYKTDEGYYVVASSDYPEGTVINTSKGEAIVLDDGTDSGNVDFYVAW